MRRSLVLMCTALVAALALVVGCSGASSSDAVSSQTPVTAVPDGDSVSPPPMTLEVSPAPDGSVTYAFADIVCGSVVFSNGPMLVTATSSAFTDLDKVQRLFVGDARRFTEKNGPDGPFFTQADALADGQQPSYDVNSCNQAGNVVDDSWLTPIRSAILAQPQTVCGTLYYDQNQVAIVTTTGTYLATGDENRYVRPGDVVRYAVDGATIDKQDVVSEDGLAACQQFVPDWMPTSPQQAPTTI